jgi:hypothetical protein
VAWQKAISLDQLVLVLSALPAARQTTDLVHLENIIERERCRLGPGGHQQVKCARWDQHRIQGVHVVDAYTNGLGRHQCCARRHAGQDGSRPVLPVIVVHLCSHDERELVTSTENRADELVPKRFVLSK